MRWGVSREKMQQLQDNTTYKDEEKKENSPGKIIEIDFGK